MSALKRIISHRHTPRNRRSIISQACSLAGLYRNAEAKYVFLPRKTQTEPSATDIQQDVEGKGSIVPVHAMKAYRWSAYKALIILNLGTRWSAQLQTPTTLHLKERAHST